MRADQLRRVTVPARPPLVPELAAPALPPGETLERFRVRHADLLGARVPYWAVAWPGGQALARFLLDRPGLAAGRVVIDLGCGNGLAAAAAARAGAARAVAVDADPLALVAAAETARLNGVAVETRLGSLEQAEGVRGSLVCLGDLWYDRETGRRATAALDRLARAGAEVICGDPGRPGRPRRNTEVLARYRVPAPGEFEARPTAEARVLAYRPAAIRPAHCPHAPGEGDLTGD